MRFTPSAQPEESVPSVWVLLTAHYHYVLSSLLDQPVGSRRETEPDDGCFPSTKQWPAHSGCRTIFVKGVSEILEQVLVTRFFLIALSISSPKICCFVLWEFFSCRFLNHSQIFTCSPATLHLSVAAPGILCWHNVSYYADSWYGEQTWTLFCSRPQIHLAYTECHLHKLVKGGDSLWRQCMCTFVLPLWKGSELRIFKKLLRVSVSAVC